MAIADFDLPLVADDARVAEEALHVPGAEPRHGLRVEAGERLSVALALVQDRRPGEAGLRSLEDEQLEEVPVVVRRHAPLVVVVSDVERVLSGTQPQRFKRAYGGGGGPSTGGGGGSSST